MESTHRPITLSLTHDEFSELVYATSQQVEILEAMVLDGDPVSTLQLPRVKTLYRRLLKLRALLSGEAAS